MKIEIIEMKLEIRSEVIEIKFGDETQRKYVFDKLKVTTVVDCDFVTNEALSVYASIFQEKIRNYGRYTNKQLMLDNYLHCKISLILLSGI